MANLPGFQGHPFRQGIAEQYGMGPAGIPSKPDAYNPYAAGPKVYGLTGRNNPTQGPISGTGLQGYAQRDQQIQSKKNAYLQRMKAAQSGNYMSPGGLSSGGF